ncbi:MAG: hypothetical protein ACXWJ8_15290, partial [Xanthobacteraceae bacterium]
PRPSNVVAAGRYRQLSLARAVNLKFPSFRRESSWEFQDPKTARESGFFQCSFDSDVREGVRRDMMPTSAPEHWLGFC